MDIQLASKIKVKKERRPGWVNYLWSAEVSPDGAEPIHVAGEHFREHGGGMQVAQPCDSRDAKLSWEDKAEIDAVVLEAFKKAGY